MTRWLAASRQQRKDPPCKPFWPNHAGFVPG
jgi:hypothetical protein